MGSKSVKEGQKILCQNRKARHEYFLEESFEVGIVLLGSEVKSIKDRRVSLQDSYATVKDDELWLINAHISEYPYANQFNHPPKRARKLLMGKKDIIKLKVKVKERGFTLIPVSLYLKNGKIKCEIALAKGKKHYDKREDLKKADQMREIEASRRR